MNLSAKTVPGALQDVSRGIILIFSLYPFESFEPQTEGALAKPLSKGLPESRTVFGLTTL